MVELVRSLLTGENVSPKAWAEQWGVTVRSVERDIQDLKNWWGPTCLHRADGIVLAETLGKSVSESLLQLNPNQKKELLILLNLGENVLLEIFGSSLEDSRQKLVSSLKKASLSHAFEDRSQIYHFLALRSDSIRIEVAEELENAILGQRRTLTWYQHPRRGKVEFVMEPWAFVLGQNHWYVFGFEVDRRFKSFWKLGRIGAVEILPTPFSPPSPEQIKEDLKAVWANQYSDHRFDVKVWFSPNVANLILDSKRHTDERKTLQPDGSLLYETQVCGWREFLWWTLSWGPDAQILEPSWMREKAIKRLEQTRNTYLAPSPNKP